MKMEIHSSFGVLIAEPLKLQAIENSISEGEVQAQDQDEQAPESIADD